MISITSSQNQLIKEVKSLKIRKNREDTKLFFIEGLRFVEEAIKENIKIDKIFISESFEYIKGANKILSIIKSRDNETYILPDKLYREISDTENPQGIMAVMQVFDYRLEEIIRDNNFLIMLDSIQDPGNLGTIIRTADAAGATGVIISKGTVDLYNPKVLRSTMGSIFHIPVCIQSNLTEGLNTLKGSGIKVCAAHLNGSANYFEPGVMNNEDNIALIIGNEANGISDEIASLADILVKIPMPGKAESLNASIAAGLLMYEVTRQRIKRGL